MSQNNPKNAIIVFVRNPELGKVKTRLAKTIGIEKALKVYKFLIQHTAQVIEKINGVEIVLFYSETIVEQDLWSALKPIKKLQIGEDLGARMEHAFQWAFSKKYEKVVIIGSDLYDLKPQHIESAFSTLDKQEIVLGPALDGGYYLLGMKQFLPQAFLPKKWGTSTVFKDTINDLADYNISFIESLNDIDVFEDLAKTDILTQIK